MKSEIKNPLAVIDEDVSRMPVQLSFFEKLGLASIIIIFICILVFASFSIIIDISRLNFLFILVDILAIIMCLTAINFVFNILRKKIVTEALIDTAFQYGVYSRLQSLIENIAEGQIGTDIIMDRLSNLDMKVESILKERKPSIEITGIGAKIMQEPIALGTSVIFVIKTIFMIVLTMAIFMFLVNFNLGIITPYATLSIFILWWLFITNEYSLWKETGAWTFVFFPIIVVPVTVIILSNLVNYNIMMALLYIVIGLYSLLYYSWAVYTKTGSIPFITPKINKFEETNKFFDAQQRGMFKEVLEEARHRVSGEEKKE